MDEGTRERRGLNPKAIVPARLQGWELTFSLGGVPYLEPAFAAVRPAPAEGIEVHGVCLQLDREGWLRLLQSEGVLGPSAVAALRLRAAPLPQVLAEAETRQRGLGGYRLERVEVQAYSAADHPGGAAQPEYAYALTDVDAPSSDSVRSASLAQSSLPSVRYWRLLRNGARRHRLRGDYRSFLWSYPRFAPSPLGPVALLANTPTLLASARQQRGQGREDRATPREWPEAVGPLAGACGSVVLGPDVPPSTWARFSSLPQRVLLERLREQLGRGVAIAGGFGRDI